ncbi:hypothetical protein CN918_29950 [Priestia megaterium]|nr:hypothetical protein CN918_29950 [Priestia megaterium]
MLLEEHTFEPSGHGVETTVKITTEQNDVLEEIQVYDEYKAYYWAEMVSWLNNGDVRPTGDLVLRAKGAHYVISLNSVNFPLGADGQHYEVKFTSGSHRGQTFVCSNILQQGEIPDELLHILVDNGTIRSISVVTP